jgi:hypothetical protein
MAVISSPDDIGFVKNTVAVPPRTVAIELLLPFHHGSLAPVFFDKLAHAIAAFPSAPTA